MAKGGKVGRCIDRYSHCIMAQGYSQNQAAMIWMTYMTSWDLAAESKGKNSVWMQRYYWLFAHEALNSYKINSKSNKVRSGCAE